MNFLAGLDGSEWEASSDSLWYLLDACRHFGWLTPNHLTMGFEEYQLKAILDLQFTNYRMEFVTYHLDEVKASPRIKGFYDLASRVVDAKGAIIASASRRNHWLVVTGEGGNVWTTDSANAGEPRQLLKARTTSYSPKAGIVILPRPQSMTEIVI